MGLFLPKSVVPSRWLAARAALRPPVPFPWADSKRVVFAAPICGCGPPVGGGGSGCEDNSGRSASKFCASVAATARLPFQAEVVQGRVAGECQHLANGDLIEAFQPFALRQRHMDELGIHALEVGKDEELLDRGMVGMLPSSRGWPAIASAGPRGPRLEGRLRWRR